MNVFSDKTKLRAPFIIGSCVVCIIGLAITAYANSVGVRYFGTFLTIAGTQNNVPAVITYSQNNILRSSKRAVTSALVIGFGGIGGIIASSEYLSLFWFCVLRFRLAVFRQKDFPGYVPG
jgi:hypothetical protein